ncbi:MAG: RNA methyltransferase [Eubacteriales bacterium]|nr:RNA methyltransferase [Eubacteriales bacterium]
MKTITSRHNPLITEMAKLKHKKHRDFARLFLFEGRKLFIEARASDIIIQYVFVTGDYYRVYENELSDYPVYVLSEGCFEKITSEKSYEGIICAAKHIDFLHFYIKIYNIDNDINIHDGKQRLLLLSNIQDPGNLGTIIRSANALGIDCIITDNECADLYNPKTIRASMGALFRQRITVCDDMISTIRNLKSGGYSVYAAAPDRSALPLDKFVISQKTCFIIGNEGHGLDVSYITETTGCVFIPMKQNSESLNASIAAAILIWEGYRQDNQ